MKKIFLVMSIFYFLSTTLVLAQADYTLLTPIDGYTQEGETTANNYFDAIFRVGIAIAGGLAVIMIIYGGIQYMSTDAISGKSEAKTTIQNAIWGLLLAIGAWLILYTINPNLVTLNLNPTAPVQEAPVEEPAP